MNELRQVFTTADGKTFDTKAEAMDYLRRPKILEAMKKVTEGNSELASWLVEHQEQVEVAFETGTIRRVTKSEHNKLAKALEALAEIQNPKIGFLQENTAAILDSFRWASVKRMDDAEKALAAKNTLTAASEGNAELADWVIANKDAILEAFTAGKEKRQVNPKASEALALYRAKKAAEKAEAQKAAA